MFVIDPGGLTPAGPARFAASAAVLAIGALVLAGRPGPAGGRSLAVSAVTWAILVVLIGGSVVAGADRWHGVFGTPERNLGFLTWVGFAVAFFVGAALPVRSVSFLAGLATVAVGALSGFAIAEWVGADPGGTAWPGSRVGAPFAQSTYLAVALVVLGPLVVGTTSDRSASSLRRGIAGLVSAAGAVALVATQSRGPVLGLGLALIVVLVVRGRPLVGVLSGMIAVGAVAALSITRGWGSFGGRLDEWGVGWRALRTDALLGLGPEGYRNRFPEVVDAAYVRANGASVITDRAHNVFIDVALSSGVPAALVLAVLWLLVARAAVIRVRERDTPVPSLGLAVGVLAGFGQQLVLFPLAEIDPVLWLLAGSLVGAATEQRTRMDRPVSDRRRQLASSAGIIAAVAMLGSLWWNVAGAVAEHRIAQSSSFRQEQAEAVADDALSLRPESVRLAYAAALVHAEGPTLLDLDEAIAILERGLSFHPDDPALRTDYVFRLVERARRSGLDADATTALEQARTAVSTAPNSPQLLGANAEALFLAGRRDEARDLLHRALDLDPDDPDLLALANSIGKS